MTGLQLLDLIGKYAGTAVATFVAGGVGAYVGSYLKKSGENRAIHENLDKLVKQMSAVTDATKQIEGRISDAIWDRQKRWELKRDALLENVASLADLELNLSKYILSFSPLAPGEIRDTTGVSDRWNEALLKLKKARLMTILLDNVDLSSGFDELERYIISTARECRTNVDIRRGWLPHFRQRTSALMETMAQELSDADSTPQSNGSSAVPTPAQPSPAAK